MATSVRDNRAMPMVYILRCRDGSLYTGATTDLARRLEQHGAGRASRYTRSRLPVEIVWRRRVRTWGDALREERRIKQLTRSEKLSLVSATPARRRTAVVPSVEESHAVLTGRESR